jgi:hypothetical protein
MCSVAKSAVSSAGSNVSGSVSISFVQVTGVCPVAADSRLCDVSDEVVAVTGAQACEHRGLLGRRPSGFDTAMYESVSWRKNGPCQYWIKKWGVPVASLFPLPTDIVRIAIEIFNQATCFFDTAEGS